MNSAKLNDWMQVVGIFALVASLIFVGLQMKQTQEIAASSAYQARAATAIELQATSAGSPEFTSGMAKLEKGDFDGILPHERVALEYFFGANMLMYENHHYQYELGYLPEEHWSRNLSELNCCRGSCLVRYWPKAAAFLALSGSGERAIRRLRSLKLVLRNLARTSSVSGGR